MPLGTGQASAGKPRRTNGWEYDGRASGKSQSPTGVGLRETSRGRNDPAASARCGPRFGLDRLGTGCDGWNVFSRKGVVQWLLMTVQVGCGVRSSPTGLLHRSSPHEIARPDASGRAFLCALSTVGGRQACPLESTDRPAPACASPRSGGGDSITKDSIPCARAGGERH